MPNSAPGGAVTAAVYLAGPDVFFPDAKRIFATRAAACRAANLDPIIPVDDRGLSATAIFEGNVRLLARVAAVLANVAPFRGPHCDVGTAWEIGYAVAKGIPVIAYSPDARPLVRRIDRDATTGRDAAGLVVENFGHAENLMIAECVHGRIIHGSFEQALSAAAALLDASSDHER